jgi:hypothetical protein
MNCSKYISYCDIYYVSAALRSQGAPQEKLAVDAGSVQSWVLGHHPEDQFPNFRRQFVPADLFRPILLTSLAESPCNPMIGISISMEN